MSVDRISTGPGIMEGVATLVPEFTDYSKWERRPSNKSGTSAGWSVGKDRGKGRRKQIQSRQQDALSLAARLSQASVLVDRSPEHTQRHCHSSSKKVSCISPPPRLVRHSTKSPERTIPKEKSAKHSILQVSLFSSVANTCTCSIMTFGTDAVRREKKVNQRIHRV